MSGKFKYPEDSKDPEGDEGAGDLVVVAEAEADVVGHDGHEIDDTHHAAHELASVRRRKQPKLQENTTINF